MASATPGTTTPTTLGPLSSATVEADCTWHATFVEDVTIPDDTVVEAGSAFVKTWRIRNSGTCAWAAGTTFGPVGGNDLGGPTFVPVPLTAPDGTVDMSATLRAPTSAGTYRSDWQLQTPNGERFGGVFYVQVVIAGQATPTITPTPEPAAVAPPRDFLGATATDCQKVTFSWIDGQGEDAYQLTGPNLNVNLAADTTTYEWSRPPKGLSVVTLVARAADDDEIGRLNTTIGVTCEQGQPDLAVIAVTFVPTVPVAHLPVTATVRVENRGDVDSGGFAVQWKSVKSAPAGTCQWIAADGLAAGGTRSFSCTVLAYSSPYATLGTTANADPTDVVAESDETNNTLEATTRVVQPTIGFDFVQNADVATWYAGEPMTPLPFPGNAEGQQGYARWATGRLETGGAIQGLCLETHPRSVAEGWVRGEFENFTTPPYTIKRGDHFRAAVSLLEGEIQGAVTFRVMLILSRSGGQSIITEPHTYGEGIEVISVDLSRYAGQTAAAVLQVNAGSSPIGDRACWVEARIYRYP